MSIQSLVTLLLVGLVSLGSLSRWGTHSANALAGAAASEVSASGLSARSPSDGTIGPYGADTSIRIGMRASAAESFGNPQHGAATPAAAPPETQGIDASSNEPYGGSWIGTLWRRAQGLITIGLGSYGVYGLLTGAVAAGSLAVALPIATTAFGVGMLWSQYHPQSFYAVFGPAIDMVRGAAGALKALFTGEKRAPRVRAQDEPHEGSAWKQLKGFVGLSVGAYGLYCLAAGVPMVALASVVLPVGAVGYGLGVIWSELHPSSFEKVISPIWNTAKDIGRSIWSWLTGKPDEPAVDMVTSVATDLRITAQMAESI